jgi:chemotaxis protein MotB
MNTFRVRWLLMVATLAFMAQATVLSGCGPSDLEMQQKQREVDQMKVRLDAAAKLHKDDEQKFLDAQNQINDLRGTLQKAGVDFENAQKNLASSEDARKRLELAIREYDQRLAQLDLMKKRFKDIQDRLKRLRDVGLKVTVRNNRMVIQLPGDVLFDSGVDNIKPDGRKILKQVADVINGDGTLKKRLFQVAGHTDNVEYGQGAFKDNWGLSLARARSVVLFLVHPADPGKPGAASGVPAGGGLDPKNWSAAGYGVMDPIAGTVEKQTPDEQKKNRRVEIVLQPNVEEMLSLDLKDFSDSP